jgi:hypothetical protein
MIARRCTCNSISEPTHQAKNILYNQERTTAFGSSEFYEQRPNGRGMPTKFWRRRPPLREGLWATAFDCGVREIVCGATQRDHQTEHCHKTDHGAPSEDRQQKGCERRKQRFPPAYSSSLTTRIAQNDPVRLQPMMRAPAPQRFMEPNTS